VPVPVPVPPVVARSASDASEHVRAVGLVPQLQTAHRYSVGGPGTVAAQDPPAGATLPPGSSVLLLVASGDVTVPAVVGLLEQDAWTMLHEAGLDITTRHARRSNVDAGRAATVDPPAGAIVPAGTTVLLTVSQGS
jgi:serine/threonine-protein kinase